MSYDLTKASELYQFSVDCDEAIFQCPQEHNYYKLELPESKKASPVEIYRYFQEDSILFELDYCNNLTEEAKSTFSRYELLRRTFFDDDNEYYYKYSLLDRHTDNIIQDKEIKLFKFMDEE
jgi:hypothetical protein